MNLFISVFCFIASLYLFNGILFIYLSWKKKWEVTFLSFSLIGCALAIYSVLVAAGYISEDFGRISLINRFQSAFLLIAQASLSWFLIRFLELSLRKFLQWILGSFLVLFLLNFALPGQVLFRGLSMTSIMVLPWHENVYMMEAGVSTWRWLTDLSMLIMAISTIYSLIAWYIKGFRKDTVFLFPCFLILLIAATLDHFVDQGAINFIHIISFSFLPLMVCLAIRQLNGVMYQAVLNKEILSNEQRWKTLLNNVNLIVVGLNRMGNVDYINPYFLRLTGFRKEDVLGKDWFHQFLPGKDTIKVQGTFLSILEDENHPVYQNPVITASGEEKMITWYNVRLMDKEGKISGSLSVGVDLSDITRVQDNLREDLSESRRIIAILESEKASLLEKLRGSRQE
jgi:PAS domain S-box-containing protein